MGVFGYTSGVPSSVLFGTGNLFGVCSDVPLEPRFGGPRACLVHILWPRTSWCFAPGSVGFRWTREGVQFTTGAWNSVMFCNGWCSVDHVCVRHIFGARSSALLCTGWVCSADEEMSLVHIWSPELCLVLQRGTLLFRDSAEFKAPDDKHLPIDA